MLSDYNGIKLKTLTNEPTLFKQLFVYVIWTRQSQPVTSRRYNKYTNLSLLPAKLLNIQN